MFLRHQHKVVAERLAQRVCDVPIPHIVPLWLEVAPLLKRPLDRDHAGRFQVEDVLAMLLQGRVRLWVSWNAETKAIEMAAVTEIVQYPRLRELKIWLIGGNNMRAWAKEGLSMIEDFARAQGCSVVSGAMRRGWIRVAASSGLGGYKETGAMFEKAL